MAKILKYNISKNINNLHPIILGNNKSPPMILMSSFPATVNSVNEQSNPESLKSLKSSVAKYSSSSTTVLVQKWSD